MADHTRQQTYLQLDAQVKRQAKACAMLEDVTFSDFVEEALRQRIRKYTGRIRLSDGEPSQRQPSQPAAASAARR